LYSQDSSIQARPVDPEGRPYVIVELTPMVSLSAMAAATHAQAIDAAGFRIDHEFGPVRLGGARPPFAGGPAGVIGVVPAAPPPITHVVRGTVDSEDAIAELRAQPGVLRVWHDTSIFPFMPCPITPCDCDPLTPKGTIADVATYIGVDQVWASGYRGAGIVVGVVDGGITAQGRPVAAGQTPRRIPNVVGGWVSDWGTMALWNEHGNMCGTDVLGMAPDANLYDLRIADAPDLAGLISNALSAFDWAITRHGTDGTPQVLTNSWGIFDQTSDPDYATDPNHPFTRKAVEAVNAGIAVLFAAGNCGEGCPDGRCATNGPGQDIWGANGHPQVITVGAVNKNGEWVGYSSEGPAALDPNKPDLCSVTHFTGYENSDNGTSAATPVLAGAVAVLRQAFPSATPDRIKQALKDTAQDIGPSGWDQYSGSGIVRVKAAYDSLRIPIIRPTSPVVCVVASRVVCPSSPPVCVTPSRFVCPTSPVVCIGASRVVCPTSPPVCVASGVACPSVLCPSVACPSLACEPGQPGFPQPTPATPAEMWYGTGEEAAMSPYFWYQEWA
jgi:subtilisin family serine protease